MGAVSIIAVIQVPYNNVWRNILQLHLGVKHRNNIGIPGR